MFQTKITIIIPVYNAGRFITRTVESVVAQTFRDWELLLVNDGSADNSGDICNRLALTDRRIKVFHKENGGASSARNFGLDHAGGDFICFIDADDQVKSSLLSDYIFYSDSDLTIGGVQKIFNNKIMITNAPESTNMSLKGVLATADDIDFISSPCNKMYRRDIIENNSLRFPTDVADVGEDILFNFSYLQHCRTISCTGKADYMYLENPNSLTHERQAVDPARYTAKRLKFMQRLGEVVEGFPDKELRGKILKEFHQRLSDAIVRPLYIYQTDPADRRRILAGYKSELRKACYSRLKASHGIFSKMIDLFCRLPLPVADRMLKLLFDTKHLIIHR